MPASLRSGQTLDSQLEQISSSGIGQQALTQALCFSQCGGNIGRWQPRS